MSWRAVLRWMRVFIVGIAPITSAWGGPLTRNRDPVVVTGANVAALVGLPPASVVAFRYDGGWVPIPVQIDERKPVDYGTVYNQSPTGYTTWAYADGTTFTGADTDTTFDADDELVFLVADAGSRAPGTAGLPGHVVATGATELEIVDPLDGGTAYAYLFASDGTLDPAAGADHVTYTFNLLAGDYRTYYSTLTGPNPEDSQFTSVHYMVHFSDRWIRNETSVLTGGATGVDILDRHKNMFGPGSCSRTENTFSNGEGAFFTNKDGPVRAIRSYMGANSGPTTQREHLFYSQREDATTFLRVHTIPGVMDLFDYSPAAAGMLYYNNLNTGGVVIDGVPDTVTVGPVTWELVTGSQGTLIIVTSVQTDISGLTPTAYYSDDSTPAVAQCTGDAYEYGTSGLWVNQTLPNTDPMLGAAQTLTSRRTIYYEAPGQSVETAAQRQAQSLTPLQVTVRPFVPTICRGDTNCDGTISYADINPLVRALNDPNNCCRFENCDVNGDGVISYGDINAFVVALGTPGLCP